MAEQGWQLADCGHLECEVDCETPEVPTVCSRCGKDPAEGFAMIGEERFCHGDDDDVTCYMMGIS